MIQIVSANIGPKTSCKIHENINDFKKAVSYNLEYNDISHEFTLAKENGSFVSNGQIVSPVIRSKFPFDTLLLSWNGKYPSQTHLRVEAQVHVGFNKWSSWYEISDYQENPEINRHRMKKDEYGYVDVDQIKLSKPSNAFRYRFSLYSDSSEHTPTLRRVSFSYANYKKDTPVKEKLVIGKSRKDWIRNLDVPYRSQMVEAKDLSWRICHPTSLSMVLDYYGKSFATAEVAQNVWDNLNNIYGNWIYNAAFAGSLGYRSYVQYCGNFDPVKEQISQGHPVILSIRYNEGELKGAPVNSTAGHIIVVRGFSEEGNPIVNDPGAEDVSKGYITLDKNELEKAWLNHSGAIVVVQPEK